MKSRLFALAAVAALVGCRDMKPASDLAGPTDPSKIILDGAHGGNKDFWFLPPMVPLPRNNPDFELGKFNNTLRPRLKIDICELNGDNLKGGGLPTELTTCGAIKKTFAPGSVQLVNLPVRQNGWWTLFNLPPDGFYYALWDTRQSNLKVDKYYRIKVFIDGNSTPLGVADVDPMANLFQWKYSLTGEVIQLVDDVLLPITFRVEKGGGSTLCGDATVCASATITNNSPDGSQTVTVDGGAGAIAGARFPNGWLPANGPQSVVVTVAQVDLGATNPVTGTQAKPCHVGLPLQQFAGCFRFTTTPALAPIDESGRQFATPVTVAVCYVLQGTGDPREKFAEMYSSGPGEPPQALEDASDVGILSPATRNCSNRIIGSNNSKGVTEFASAGWQKIKGGFGALFGVKTAYGVDLGLGGIAKRFSNIGPALTTTLQPVSATEFVLPGGGTVQRFVRLVGTNHHDGEHQNATGLGQLPVTFSITSGPVPSTLSALGQEGGAASQLIATTNTSPIDPESPTSGGGYAAVNWQVPGVPGAYHLTATGPALGGPINFTVTVPVTNAPFVRVCSVPNGSEVPNVPDLQTAINVVAPNGTVAVCGGTHSAPFVNLTGKSLTIEGEEGAVPTLDGTGQRQIFFIGSQTPADNVVILRNLRLQNAEFTGVDIEQNFGSVLIDNVHFFPAHGPPPNPDEPSLAYSSGVFVFNTSGGGVTVQNSSFSGGDIGVHVNNATNVVVTNNNFDNQTNAAIHGDGGIIASHNVIQNCGPHWCVGLFGSARRGNSKLLNNFIFLNFNAPSERNAIQAYNTVVEITGNTIGVESGIQVLPPGFSAWPMAAGVAVDGASEITFSGNQIFTARFGLTVYNGTTVTGSGNTILNTGQALNFFQPGLVNITRSNFFNYTAAFGGATSNVSLRCNWWGSIDGPTNIIGANDPELYTPWAGEQVVSSTEC